MRGAIRLALPVIYGTREVIPSLDAFLARHPLLRIELRVSDLYQDLVAEGVDVAIRLGKLADSGFGARKIATLPRFVVAAPAYLKARGIPKSPADLAGHECLFNPNGFDRDSWGFKRGNTMISVEVRGRIQTNSAPALHACAMAGLGIAQASAAMCGAELRSGALVALLAGYALEPVEVHAVFPGGPRLSAKVRALADHLAANGHAWSGPL